MPLERHGRDSADIASKIGSGSFILAVICDDACTLTYVRSSALILKSNKRKYSNQDIYFTYIMRIKKNYIAEIIDRFLSLNVKRVDHCYIWVTEMIFFCMN